MKNFIVLILASLMIIGCKNEKKKVDGVAIETVAQVNETPFVWDGAKPVFFIDRPLQQWQSLQ